MASSVQEKEAIFDQQDQICADKDSFGNEIVPKIRKPYTITKQRERWTEDEHKKFLEALQLYGRAWRQIEEHIGTKTTVQIRSHAQKFFSKVIKEPTNIEIPPPRPKRKPSHPYPRKLANPPKKDSKFAQKLGKLISQTSQKGTSSPTSVLSSENLDSNGSKSPFESASCENLDSNGSKSPLESASGSNLDSNGSKSPFESASGSNDQENGSQSPTATSAVENLCSNPEMPIMEDEQAPSIKLFGKTVVLTESNKSTSNSNTSENNDIVYNNKEIKNNNSDQIQSQNTTNPFFYYLPFWSGTWPNPIINPYQIIKPYHIINPLIGNYESQLKQHENESSLTGSNEVVDENFDADIKEKKDIIMKPMRGFVPYKRCKMEVNLDKDGERKEGDINMCL